MAVVVNEFEVLPAAPPPARPDERASEAPREPPSPPAVSQALRVLEVHALRAWAH